MRKVMILFFICMLLAIAGCSDNGNPASSEDETGGDDDGSAGSETTPGDNTTDTQANATINQTLNGTGDGTGVAEEPQKEWVMVTSCQELREMSLDLDESYMLASDIDCTYSQNYDEGKGFFPLGTLERPFEGEFEGNGSRIFNLFIDRPDTDNVGLFGVTNTSAVIRNVTLMDSKVTGGSYVGSLVGNNFGARITNIDSDGIVTGTMTVGGLVGLNEEGRILDLGFTGKVNGEERVGGLIGSHKKGLLQDSSTTPIIEATSHVGGAIGYSLSSDVRNVTVSLPKNNRLKGNSHKGGLIGMNHGRSDIGHVTVSGFVYGKDKTGGLIGYNENGQIRHAIVDAEVRGNKKVGGLIGSHLGPSGLIAQSESKKRVIGKEWVGGLVGYMDEARITHSKAYGEVSGTNRVGGLVGTNNNAGSLSFSHNENDVTGVDKVGAVVGFNSGPIEGCSGQGIIEGEDYVGGIAGSNSGGKSVVTDSYSTANVSGERYVAGLVGFTIGGADGNVIHSYAVGSVEGEKYVGGLIGRNAYNNVLESAYWDMNRTGQEISDGGLGRTTREMSFESTYIGWDFDDTWVMLPNATAPVLRNEYGEEELKELMGLNESLANATGMNTTEEAS